MTAVVIIEGVVIVLLLILVAGLLRSHAEILRQLDRLGGGSAEPRIPGDRRLRTTGLGRAPASEIVGTDPDGAAISVSLRHGRGETLLAFLSTGCASCRIFWSDLAMPEKLPPGTRPLVVTKGAGSESPGVVRDLAPQSVTVVMSDEAWDAFRVPLTPYFMWVDDDGAISGEGSATDMNHLMSLFAQSSADSAPDPKRLGSRKRQQFTDDQIGRSGIEPGDPSLYEDPIR
ncbi:MAG: hypothetical protein WAL25_15585 [Acidimicrobiia bacterium]